MYMVYIYSAAIKRGKQLFLELRRIEMKELIKAVFTVN